MNDKGKLEYDEVYQTLKGCCHTERSEAESSVSPSYSVADRRGSLDKLEMTAPFGDVYWKRTIMPPLHRGGAPQGAEGLVFINIGNSISTVQPLSQLR